MGRKNKSKRRGKTASTNTNQDSKLNNQKNNKKDDETTVLTHDSTANSSVNETLNSTNDEIVNNATKLKSGNPILDDSLDASCIQSVNESALTESQGNDSSLLDLQEYTNTSQKNNDNNMSLHSTISNTSTDTNTLLNNSSLVERIQTLESKAMTHFTAFEDLITNMEHDMRKIEEISYKGTFDNNEEIEIEKEEEREESLIEHASVEIQCSLGPELGSIAKNVQKKMDDVIKPKRSRKAEALKNELSIDTKNRQSKKVDGVSMGTRSFIGIIFWLVLALMSVLVGGVVAYIYIDPNMYTTFYDS